MTAVGDSDPILATKCLDFCQALSSQGVAFNFSLSIGSTFSFSLDTRVKASVSPGTKKRSSPSTLRRNARRKEEFLKKKQNPAVANLSEETVGESLSPKCNHCDYKAASEKGLRQHIRMKHRVTQPDSRLPPSFPSTPESLRESQALRNSLITMSPIAATNRDDTKNENLFKCWAPVDGCEETFKCEEDLKHHIDYDHSSTICHNCKEEFWEHEEYKACPACSYAWR